MRTIDPNLFTRLMLLPETTRFDLLEFVGATAVADIQLSDLIENVSHSFGNDHSNQIEAF